MFQIIVFLLSHFCQNPTLLLYSVLWISKHVRRVRFVLRICFARAAAILESTDRRKLNLLPSKVLHTVPLLIHLQLTKFHLHRRNVWLEGTIIRAIIINCVLGRCLIMFLGLIRPSFFLVTWPVGGRICSSCVLLIFAPTIDV